MTTWLETHPELAAEAAETLRLVAEGCSLMAEAIDEKEDITGIGAGMILANHLPRLPKHIRDTFMEYLSDEEAASLVMEERYWEAMAEHNTGTKSQ